VQTQASTSIQYPSRIHPSFSSSNKSNEGSEKCVVVAIYPIHSIPSISMPDIFFLKMQACFSHPTSQTNFEFRERAVQEWYSLKVFILPTASHHRMQFREEKSKEKKKRKSIR
jgi:hypothetical protein